jgi:hypothetical protein
MGEFGFCQEYGFVPYNPRNLTHLQTVHWKRYHAGTTEKKKYKLSIRKTFEETILNLKNKRLKQSEQKRKQKSKKSNISNNNHDNDNIIYNDNDDDWEINFLKDFDDLLDIETVEFDNVLIKAMMDLNPL